MAHSHNGQDEPFYLRKRHRYERGFTILDNGLAQSDQLSFRAIGLATYLWSLPDGSPINSAALAALEHKEGRDAIRTAMAELVAAGFVRRTRRQVTKGRWVTDVELSDQDIFSKSPGGTEDGLPGVGGPGVGGPGAKNVKDRTTSGGVVLTGRDTSGNQRTAITDGMRRLCELMADHAQEMTGERPAYGDRWLTACRLLVTRDGLGEDGVEAMIRWVMADGFWSPNVLSMTKLREKRPQLTAKMRAGPGSASRPRVAPNGGRVPTFEELDQAIEYLEGAEHGAGPAAGGMADGSSWVAADRQAVQRALPVPADSSADA